MIIDITVPAVGESIAEGTLSRWLKKDGATVRADEPVLELETEKATTEIAAPSAGTLHITVPEGQTVRIGAVVGRIEEGSAVEAESRKQGPPRDVSASPRSSVPASLSPAARRLAEESGVDAGQLRGTGRDGRIIKEDVQIKLDGLKAASREQKAETPSGSAKPPADRGETRQKMSAIRQRIAARLLASQQNTATLTTFNEADLSAVMELRSRYKERFQEKHGVGLGFMSFFVKAAVEALRAFPLVNSRIDGGDIVTPSYYDIGVAVSSERGLMVPVLRDADRMGFAQIEKNLAELAKKARDGRIAVEDLQGGTFTITNGGVFGSLLSTPILNPPQSAILGLHAIQKRPVAVDDQVVIRPMMYLALSYDHRLIDGREAVLFLARVKECVEKPERLLLEI